MESKSGKNGTTELDVNGANTSSSAKGSKCACPRQEKNDCAMQCNLCCDDEGENTGPRVHGILTCLDFLHGKSFCKSFESPI